MKLAALSGVLLTAAVAVSADCPDSTWLQLDGQCYWWSGALLRTPGDRLAEACSLVHAAATPVSVHSREEDTFLYQLTAPYDAWLGLRRDNSGAGWTWGDGSDVDLLFWARAQPGEEFNCAAMNYDRLSGEWGVLPCEEEHYFVCQLPASTPPTPTTTHKPTPTPTPTPTTPSACPGSNWSELNGVCYWSSDYNPAVDGDEVAAACRDVHPSAVPASVQSYTEDAFLTRVKSNFSLPWLGLSRAEDGADWAWTEDGRTADYVNWGRGEPQGGNNCVVMSTDGEGGPAWMSRRCSGWATAFYCQVTL